jgi:transposase
MPLTNRVLDGAASDVEWNRIALEHVSDIYSSGFRSGIYVADCKLVTEEHVAAMNDPGRHVRFVSRCPANFHDSLERRTIKEAYEAGQWDEIGPVSEAKGAAQYKSAPLTAEVCGTPMRLLVLESSELKRKAELALRQKEEALALVMKAFEKKQWACLPDAEAERGRVLGLKQLSLFDCDIRIDECTTEKWPRGRRGKNTKPSIVTTYRLRAESTSRNAPGCREFLQNESCFVLISNAAGDVSDEDLLKTYKGQQVVENSFRELKSPHLASVIYLKNPTRITAVSMLLTFSLLVRALIQYRLREGLKTFNEKHPDIKICAGWGGRRLKNPTFKLLYEHSVNCVFERESQGEYSFSWPSSETRAKIEPLLKLMGLSLARLVE